jgi:hypothetical protein
MPLPVGLAAVLLEAAKVTGVSGSLADYASLAFTIVDHVKAQEGLRYNPHAFFVPEPSPPQATPARKPSSAASPGQSGGKSAAVPPREGRPVPADRTSLPLLSIRNSTSRIVGSASAEAVFGVSVYYLPKPSGDRDVLHLVHLTNIRGFATAVGDQAEVEFSGQAVDGGYVLSAKGIVNEIFSGFFHFWCDFLVQVPKPSPVFSDDSSSWIRPLQSGLAGEGGRIEWQTNEFLISF